MIISKKKHLKIVEDLKEKLKKAEDLKGLLTEIINKTGLPDKKDGKTILMSSDGIIAWDCASEFDFGDKVPVYKDDIYGGKVIKQEATKVVKLDKEGKKERDREQP